MNLSGGSTTHFRHPNCYDSNLTQNCRSTTVTVRSKTTRSRPSDRRIRILLAGVLSGSVHSSARLNEVCCGSRMLHSSAKNLRRDAPLSSGGAAARSADAARFALCGNAMRTGATCRPRDTQPEFEIFGLPLFFASLPSDSIQPVDVNVCANLYATPVRHLGRPPVTSIHAKRRHRT